MIMGSDHACISMLRIALAGAGYAVRVAETGKEGLSVVYTWRPDLVITSDSLTDIAGPELSRTLRSAAGIETIIMVRTSLGREDSAQFLDAGADDCVMMCCSLGELKARIRRKLQRKSDLMAS
jgi:two-component system KDP operon response regulator KdpE